MRIKWRGSFSIGQTDLDPVREGNDPPSSRPLGLSNVKGARMGASMHGRQLVLGCMRFGNIRGRDGTNIDVLVHVPDGH
jgi:hypothetical protein